MNIRLLFSAFLLVAFFFCVDGKFLNKADACFGDKLGISFIKGDEAEFSANLMAIYIKEKTGIDSVISSFNNTEAVASSFKKNETDIMIWLKEAKSVDISKLASQKSESDFFQLVETEEGNVIFLEVSKKRLAEMKFFTLNKLMSNVGKLINADEFKKRIEQIKSGVKFPKQSAREYLLEKDMI